MSLEILDPLYTLTIDVFPQLAWTIWVIGGLTLYLIIRAILEIVL